MNLKPYVFLIAGALFLQGCTVQPKKPSPSSEVGTAQPELDKVDENGRMNVDPRGPQPVPKTSLLDNFQKLTLS
jgi:PBP1b-binding outer membrane lipoprotein LpoB